MNPKLSSAFRNLAEQVQRARELNSDANILSVDKDLKYPGGLGDTSHFNSIVVVSNRFMEALKILTGDFHRKGSKAAKPIISFASLKDASLSPPISAKPSVGVAPSPTLIIISSPF